MKRNILDNAGLLLLAIVFSTGLMFAFIELPRLLDAGLQTNFGFPQFDHGLGGTNALKTELFIEGLHLRWIGYGSLLLILGLIIVGYTTRRSGWAIAGAVGLFIPVFGQFAFSMFFLAGLGFLRVGWLPFIEFSSFSILDLGKVIYIPYWILMWIFGLFNWHPYSFIAWLFMASGAFLFTWGVLVWFKSRYRKSQVATSWIYKISRHPQYLGWILWSYGMILFSPFEKSMKITWSVPSSLPWLLMTMIIVGICMMEEIKMMKITGGSYQTYRESTPFLFPLPSWLNRILGWPARLVTRGDYPEQRSQVVWIVLIYTVVLMALSLFWVDLGLKERKIVSDEVMHQELSEVMEQLDEAGDNRREVYSLIREVSNHGPAGIDSLQVLADHPNPLIREFSIQFLGDMNEFDAEGILIRALNDSIRRVRNSAIIATGKIRSAAAVDSLIRMMVHPRMPNNLFNIYAALGEIGDPVAVPYLAESLKEGEFYNQIAALDAIMKIDPDLGVAYAINELQDENVEIRRNAVIVCIRSGNQQVIEPLKSCHDDEDFEVRFYAKQAVRRLQKLQARGAAG